MNVIKLYKNTRFILICIKMEADIPCYLVLNDFEIIEMSLLVVKK